jgi:hypothetical protein
MVHGDKQIHYVDTLMSKVTTSYCSTNCDTLIPQLNISSFYILRFLISSVQWLHVS